MSLRTRTEINPMTRRALLKSIASAPLLLKAAPLCCLGFPVEPLPVTEVRFRPHYPAQSPLADVLRLVPPGSDDYPSERDAFEIEELLNRWGQDLKLSPGNNTALATLLDEFIEGSSLVPSSESVVRDAYGITIMKRSYGGGQRTQREHFIGSVHNWLGAAARIDTAEFEIFGIDQIDSNPNLLRTDLRYDFVAMNSRDQREERVGTWRIEWTRNGAKDWKARIWEWHDERVFRTTGPVFVDVTKSAMGRVDSFNEQMLHGADYWRTILDGAIGTDLYGNNGIAAGDYDNDGFDDLYVSQPAGLPNRLYRNRGDGTFEDVTEKAGVGVLDNTACALFADFQNRGRQDLLVVCGTGPLLFSNQGDGTFLLKRDAFKFSTQTQGTFTHAAIADYDRDGLLDIYFCTYMYYLGLEQYHYPIPYYDARNGPPNCLFRNRGDGTFVETTTAAGLDADNDRYSFACAWGDSNSNGAPDLFVANDFGSSQLYRNQGDGTFKVASKDAHVESVGAGMGCCWADYDNDGHQDIYVPSMWEAAGQRVAGQKQFHEKAPPEIRELYQRHARGNALYRNNGDGTFQNVGHDAAAEMGRWSWSSDFWDFDHDGYADLYVANGYISAPDRNDLASFFWRQVVAKSPEDATPATKYERGWNAINELVRSDNTWHGYARNVMFANNHDGTFTEASGAVGLDCLEDSRSFALADIDHDGRLEVIVKNRNAPQVRILHNSMKDIGHSICFRLRGKKSNRDAIGTAVTVEAGSLKQTKYLQAGSGFLSQHSKELFFGLGTPKATISATVRWISGVSEKFENIPSNHRIEIEEGSGTFQGKPFDSSPLAHNGLEKPGTSETLPSQVATWLIEPLRAPAFSLPNLAGDIIELKSFRGSYVFLTFWSSVAPRSIDHLKMLNSRFRAVDAINLRVLGVNLDASADIAAAQLLAREEQFVFPLLFSSEETAGIYNLLYQHMFDRRRNLPIPASFLIDTRGMIIKVYEGPSDPENILSDVRSSPKDAAERMSRALPFRGILAQDTFARNDFTFGVAMYQHGYLNEAAASFEQVIVAKPDSADAYYNLGTLNLRRNDIGQARGYLEQTLKLRPNYPEAWNNLGMIAAQEGSADEAAVAFRKAISLRPGYVTALLNLGNLYRRQRSFDKSKECLTSALSMQPDDPEVNYSLGMLFAQANQLQSAADYLQRAIDLRPDYAEALNNLGVLFVRERDFAKAEEQFKSGIRVAPEYDQSYINLARLYAMRSDKASAKEVLQDLLRIQPNNTGARQAMEMLQ